MKTLKSIGEVIGRIEIKEKGEIFRREKEGEGSLLTKSRLPSGRLGSGAFGLILPDGREEGEKKGEAAGEGDQASGAERPCDEDGPRAILRRAVQEAVRRGVVSTAARGP